MGGRSFAVLSSILWNRTKTARGRPSESGAETAHQTQEVVQPPYSCRVAIIRPMNAVTTSIYDNLWKLLEEGSSNRRHAFHTPVLATRTSSGDPDLRTVVLRRVDRGLGLVCCHTDSRSQKVREIESSSRVAWLFYDPQSRVQIRAHGRCEVHQGPADEMAREIWLKVHPDSRVCYWAPHAPSSAIDGWESNQAADARDIAKIKPMPDDRPPATFAVLATVLDSIEWLELHHDGHRRIRFSLGNDIGPKAQWLAP